MIDFKRPETSDKPGNVTDNATLYIYEMCFCEHYYPVEIVTLKKIFVRKEEKQLNSVQNNNKSLLDILWELEMVWKGGT